jgi:3'-phosphoadenosine 5'-phosphosulfate sulfotransferase (PAPS reductase)/FAD synthetase
MLDGSVKTVERGGEPQTRMVFPAMVADLRTRWCSAYLKIDVAKKVITNDPRFEHAKTLIVTGERRQESANRSAYEEVKDYGSTKKRTVHQWRAVLSWYEDDVWEIIERYRVRPHPAYYLGWSRVSCLPCIFGDPNQWATISEILPKVVKRLGDLEMQFGHAAQTMPNHPRSRESQYRRWQHRWSLEGQREVHEDREEKLAKKLGSRFVPTPFVMQPVEPFKFKPFDGFLRGMNESIPEAAARGESYVIPYGSKYLKLGISEELPEGYARLERGEKWIMPTGAFGHSGGPT